MCDHIKDYNESYIYLCWYCWFSTELYRVRKITSIFLENALKKTTEYFLKLNFLFESTILSVNTGK